MKADTLAESSESTKSLQALEPLIGLDPYLKPYANELLRRQLLAKQWLDAFDASEGGIENFSLGFKYYGFQVDKSGIVFREWLPNSAEVWLMGDFNNWNRYNYSLRKVDSFGTWEIRLAPDTIKHNTKVKLVLRTLGGEILERVPAWIRRVVQDRTISPAYDAVFWNPPEPYLFKNPRPEYDLTKGGIKVYEAHVGISSPDAKISSYNEFTESVLPRIADLGYNCIQLMAVMEHAYYASFGYQVTSFFAASSRFGTPEDLKLLVDTAHGYNITVLLDVVHSHASSNSSDGLNMLDGTDFQYFHGGPKGNHMQWGSRLFNYGKHEVLRFLLSNLRFWVDEYQFDGFRFDGVTSMLYTNHGIGTGFSGGYDEYFGPGVDEQAVTYLILANHLIKSLSSRYVSIAEDVSGMPTLCLPTHIAGIGFDYRLAMAVPDMWIKILKEKKDEDWDMGNIAHTLTNRRYGELTIGYAESHDQALVGDKTLAFWLMDKDMYTSMSVLSPPNHIIDRGMALHKMIRLVTHALSGEGYLNFEGNEFGHPEWLDFPRAGNNESYQYARRQFNLVDDPLLLYQFLYAFDRAMQHSDSRFHWLKSPQAYVSTKHNGDKVLAFDRQNLVFVFNFHPTKSFEGYRIGVPRPGKYRVVLCTDDKSFHGHNRVDHEAEHFSTEGEWNGRPHSIQIYLPSRTAVVYAILD